MSIQVITRTAAVSKQLDGGNVAEFSNFKECLELVIENGEICLRIPFIGDICVDVPPVIPDGTVAVACLEFSFPACFKLTVTALGMTIVDEQFGICG